MRFIPSPTALAGAAAAASLALATPATGAQPTVVIDKMAFGAPPKGLVVGQTLVFHNADIFEHSATAKGEFDLDLKPGATGAVVLKHAGTIAVACRFHPTMKLQLVVGPAAAHAGHR